MLQFCSGDKDSKRPCLNLFSNIRSPISQGAVKHKPSFPYCTWKNGLCSLPPHIFHLGQSLLGSIQLTNVLQDKIHSETGATILRAFQSELRYFLYFYKYLYLGVFITWLKPQRLFISFAKQASANLLNRKMETPGCHCSILPHFLTN